MSKQDEAQAWSDSAAREAARADVSAWARTMPDVWTTWPDGLERLAAIGDFASAKSLRLVVMGIRLRGHRVSNLVAYLAGFP